MSDTPKLPPSPTSIRRPIELPLDSTPRPSRPQSMESVSSELPPLDLPSAGGLINFDQEGLLGYRARSSSTSHTAGHMDASFSVYSTLPPEFSGFTPSQLYDMNQQFMNDAVPERPLIDAVTPMSSLRSEYENGSPTFLKQIDWLVEHQFGYVRRARGDGDCFYRSLGFAYVENLINSGERDFAVASSLSILESTKATLDNAGIEKMVYEDFYEDLETLVQSITKPGKDGRTLNTEQLLLAFQQPEVSNSIVIYLRFLTSAQIRLNRDSYEGFLEHPDTKEPIDVDSFCANVVQAMGKEADNVEIEALSRALQLNIDVAYLNGVRGDAVDFIKFRYDLNPDSSPVVLLYRPGHYDILVQKP